MATLGIIASMVLSGLVVFSPAMAGTGSVLILGSTVSGGESSEEAQAAVAAGYTVDVVSDEEWAAMTGPQFGSYRALVLGDPTCGDGAVGGVAEDNRDVWGPRVDGNILINGTDPVFHSFQGGARLTANGVVFAADEPDKTGLYVSLSCAYDSAENEAVPLLDPFGTFTVRGAGCYNDAHIVAAHPALEGLDDEDLSNWSCSVHEEFVSWPENRFLVLAIAEREEGEYVAPDGSRGTPYILASGEGLEVISDIRLTPEEATNPLGEPHTLTATVMENDEPTEGATVTFSVISGPNAGTDGTDVTDAAGEATFTYTSTTAGTDRIEATFVDSGGDTQTSNRATKVWEGDTGDLPVLDIDDVTGMEGDSGKTDFVFTVTRTGDTSGSSSVHYRTKEKTATVPQDFVPVDDAILTFGPGDESATITIKVKGDGKRAPDETFLVLLSDPTNATIGDGRGKGTILYDDPYLKIRNLAVDEPASGFVKARFKVVLSYPTISGVTVHYGTRDGSATAGEDYIAKADKVLTFAPGERVKYAKVKVLANAPSESDETFFVDLVDATGPDGALRIEDATGRGTIRD